jgi:hypothetical protein
VRLTIIHDVHGNITSVAASPPNSGIMYLGTKPGQSMAEVDGPELTLDQGMEHLRKHLTNLINNYRVLTKSSENKLTKKPALQVEK